QGLDAFARQQFFELVETGAPLFGAPDGQVKEDVFAGNEDALLDGGLETATNLVGNGVLKATGVACVNGPDGLGLVLGQQGLVFGHQGIDLALGLVVELASFGLDLFPTAWSLAPSGTARGP